MELENRFKDFVKNIQLRYLSSDNARSRSSFRNVNSVGHNFTLEEIEEIIRSGSATTLRDLSRYYYRTSGIYRNVIDFSANLSKYDTMVIPILDPNKTASKSQTIKLFYEACRFVDNLHVPQTFARISRLVYTNGVYYGLLREEGDKVTIQDLPLDYCRARFRDSNDLEVLEFNLNYFMTIKDDEYKQVAINTYPQYIQKMWKKYNNKVLSSPWIEIPPEEGGIVFSYGDRTPPFIAAIPSIYQMDDAVGREAERDENELYKLLIQKMPITSRGELVFQLPEVEQIHAGTSEMLKNTDTVDVLTTFGDAKLESLQDSTAATQSTSRIEKYVNTAYNNLGISKLFFNCDTASGMEYAIKKHEALIKEINGIYSIWIKFQLNDRFARSKVTFDFDILPTTIFNQREVQEKYFQGAQYGYSKFYAGAAMGIKQIDQLSLMDFENDYLNMTEKMLPLQSTYTSSGNIEKNSESGGQNRKNNSDSDNSNDGIKNNANKEEKE